MTQPSDQSLHSFRWFPILRSRLTLGLGIVAGVLGCLSIQALANRIEGILFDSALHNAVARPNPPAFGQGPFQITKILSGVNGQTFSPAAMHVLEQASMIREDNPLSPISPVALGRLSAGGCITLTTKSGQTVSFRITGSHPMGEPQGNTQPKIDLMVTTCPATGEPVTKAVIEPAQQSTDTLEPRNL